MLLASWNINSIRARQERFLRWLSARQPDVLCLQELKCTEDQFPFEAIKAAGYSVAVFGQNWMRRLREYLDRRQRTGEPLILCGDFNVAPEPRDVERPEVWASTVLFHPEVREALRHVAGFGLDDTFRLHRPEGGFYSWWDYRQLSFPRNDGLRLDLILATPSVARACAAASIDRDERKGKQASDHAPVLATFDLP